MTDRAAAWSGWTYLRWAWWLPCALGVVVADLLAAADLVGVTMESWDTPAPGLGWMKAGAVGQLCLAVAAVAVLTAGAASPGYRRSAAMAAVLRSSRWRLAGSFGPLRGFRPSAESPRLSGDALDPHRTPRIWPHNRHTLRSPVDRADQSGGSASVLPDCCWTLRVTSSIEVARGRSRTSDTSDLREVIVGSSAEVRVDMAPRSLGGYIMTDLKHYMRQKSAPLPGILVRGWVRTGGEGDVGKVSPLVRCLLSDGAEG